VTNLPPVLTTPAVQLAKFTSNVVETSGKFSTSDLRISLRIFEQIQKEPYVIFRGLEEDDS
jgi:hypothetical protein